MKKSILTLVLLTAVCLNTFAWGQKGHDVTAYIAEQHLTPAARAAGAAELFIQRLPVCLPAPAGIPIRA